VTAYELCLHNNDINFDYCALKSETLKYCLRYKNYDNPKSSKSLFFRPIITAK